MYTRFFGLKQVPFSIAPDPRYLFMSEQHREALAHLLYGLNGGGGFVLLTGEIGAGKTTVCRLFLEQIPAHCNVAYIFNPKQTVTELLQSICDEFGVAVPRTGRESATVKDFIDPLNAYLLAAHGEHRNNVLIIDEAQNLSTEVLEQLRLLTNLETNERKLLQILLIGQPELREMLAAPGLEQLAQRVIARFHLAALTAPETALYIAHRLAVAGNDRALPFTARGMRQIHALARGIPRRVNLLCDRALLGAYAGGKARVDAATIARAAREVFDLDARRGAASPRAWKALLPGSMAAILAIGVVGFSIGRMLPGPGAGAPAAPAIASRPAVNSALPRSPNGAPVDTGVASASSTVPPSPPGAQTTASSAVPGANPSAAPTTQVDASAPPATSAAIVGAQARELSAAYRQLGYSWHLDPADGDPCVTTTKPDLHCFSSNKGLVEIRRLDRPGILTLYDDQNQKYYGVLTGLGSQSATLRIGERSESVTLTALARRWRGAYTTFWRGPPGTPREIDIGASGADVDWMAVRLARIGNLSRPGTNLVFDAAMSARVREFQLAQGLAPDGIAGPQTMMRLASVVDSGEPHLGK